MLKRMLDLVASGLGLLVLSPALACIALAVYLEDRHSPFYIAQRVGKGGATFRMVKLRSMVVNADKLGVDSTAGDDPRITRVGRYIRAFKLDEFSQLWNVLKGDMSLVGPRPNVERDVRLYTEEERRLLGVQPGITDFASIVFADESDILEGSRDPDLKYNQVIRPWKSRMGLVYVDRASLWLDIRLILATLRNAVDRPAALRWVASMLREVGAEERLVQVAQRVDPLEAAPPPGAHDIVHSRSVQN